MAASYPPLADRPLKNTIALFDVDKTLTPARGSITPEMLLLLSQLRSQCALGYVGGSDLSKQQEQMGAPAGVDVRTLFDFCFPENGLTPFKLGAPLPATNFITWLGEDRYKQLVKFVLRYISDLDIPVMRGTFVEFRAGMINVSPIGRNASVSERDEFEAYDKVHGVRGKMVEALRERFGGWGLTFSVGGQISFDVFPTGWDKTFCLGLLEEDAKKEGGVVYETIHFFGDKTFKGGNDYEIYEDERTIGHSVTGPEDTMRQVKEVFGL
ncbi:eukaryotic phosphomannomutase [Podospora conica]|nr:eukaryotic phosphomannomutase [Schizothecium conicum]